MKFKTMGARINVLQNSNIATTKKHTHKKTLWCAPLVCYQLSSTLLLVFSLELLSLSPFSTREVVHLCVYKHITQSTALRTEDYTILQSSVLLIWLLHVQLSPVLTTSLSLTLPCTLHPYVSSSWRVPWIRKGDVNSIVWRNKKIIITK